jgi:hypothetical protein
MRSIVVPARAGLLIAVLVLAGCGSGGGSSTSAASSAQPSVGQPSVAASAAPSAPPSAEGVPAGWERVAIEDRGFAMALPSGWEVADLTSGDIEGMLELLGDDPQLEAFGDQLPALMESGIALWAISLDADAVATGFATNLNVLVEDPMPASFDTYVAANVSFIENTFSVDVGQEAVQLPAGDAMLLTYEPTIQGAGTYHVTQYILTADGRALIATFSRAIGAEFEGLEADFLEIMETVTFLP